MHISQGRAPRGPDHFVFTCLYCLYIYSLGAVVHWVWFLSSPPLIHMYFHAHSTIHAHVIVVLCTQVYMCMYTCTFVCIQCTCTYTLTLTCRCTAHMHAVLSGGKCKVNTEVQHMYTKRNNVHTCTYTVDLYVALLSY